MSHEQAETQVGVLRRMQQVCSSALRRASSCFEMEQTLAALEWGQRMAIFCELMLLPGFADGTEVIVFLLASAWATSTSSPCDREGWEDWED